MKTDVFTECEERRHEEECNYKSLLKLESNSPFSTTIKAPKQLQVGRTKEAVKVWFTGEQKSSICYCKYSALKPCNIM